MTDSYAEHSALTTLVGESPPAKILAALLKTPGSLTTTRIAELGGMSRSSVYKYIDLLININVVTKESRGNTTVYSINKQSPVAQKLAELEYELVDVAENEVEEDNTE
jgi:predicted transcriptional regulator